MVMEFYLRIPEENVEALLPALEAAGATPKNDIVCVDWESTKRKKFDFSIITGDNLDQMAQEFNEFLESQNVSQRIKDTSEMNIHERYRTLQFLCTNAEWYLDCTMDKSWMDGWPSELNSEMHRYQLRLEDIN